MTEIPTQDLLILCDTFIDIHNHIIRYTNTRYYELFDLFYKKSNLICEQYFPEYENLKKSYGT